VPQSNRELAGHDGGAALDTVFDDFEEITRLLGREGLESKIVDRRYSDTRPGGHQPGQAAVAAGSERFGEHARGSEVERSSRDG
jgi:hypothetical protein